MKKMKMGFFELFCLVLWTLVLAFHNMSTENWYSGVFFEAFLVFTLALGIEHWLSWVWDRAKERHDKQEKNAVRFMHPRDQVPRLMQRFYTWEFQLPDVRRSWTSWALTVLVAVVGYHAYNDPVTIMTYVALAGAVLLAQSVYLLALIGAYRKESKDDARSRMLLGVVICFVTVLGMGGNFVGLKFVLESVAVVAVCLMAILITYGFTKVVKLLWNGVRRIRSRLALADRLEAEVQALQRTVVETLGEANITQIMAYVLRLEDREINLKEEVLEIEGQNRTLSNKFTTYTAFITNLLRELLPDVVQVANECSELSPPDVNQSHLASWRQRLNLAAALIALHADAARERLAPCEIKEKEVWNRISFQMTDQGRAAVCRRFTIHTRPENTSDLRWAPSESLETLRSEYMRLNGPAPKVEAEPPAENPVRI